MKNKTVILCAQIGGKPAAPGEAYMLAGTNDGFIAYGKDAKRRAVRYAAATELEEALEKCRAVIGDLVRAGSDNPEELEAYEDANAALALAEGTEL